ncbi:MAG: hypothetical protein AB7P44_10720 [Steroidobacteraceae bacterium]
MNRIAIAFVAASFGCLHGSSSLAEDKALKALEEALEAFETKKRSTPENIESIPAMRALIPPTAQHRSYPTLDVQDRWVVSNSLADVMTWYRQAMAQNGFTPKLRACLDPTILGGDRVVIVDYCSETHHSVLRLGEDTLNGVTTIQLLYSTRPPSFDCSALGDREKWIKNCPVELHP